MKKVAPVGAEGVVQTEQQVVDEEVMRLTRAASGIEGAEELEAEAEAEAQVQTDVKATEADNPVKQYHEPAGKLYRMTKIKEGAKAARAAWKTAAVKYYVETHPDAVLKMMKELAALGNVQPAAAGKTKGAGDEDNN